MAFEKPQPGEPYSISLRVVRYRFMSRRHPWCPDGPCRASANVIDINCYVAPARYGGTIHSFIIGPTRAHILTPKPPTRISQWTHHSPHNDGNPTLVLPICQTDLTLALAEWCRCTDFWKCSVQWEWQVLDGDKANSGHVSS